MPHLGGKTSIAPGRNVNTALGWKAKVVARLERRYRTRLESEYRTRESVNRLTDWGRACL
jgi:hypothetical protein